MGNNARVSVVACVELEAVEIRYGRLVALRDVTLAVQPGQVLCVRGANGAGKTTLLRALAGVAQPSQGFRRGPGRVAYVPAELAPPRLSAGRWLRGIRPRRSEDPLVALEQLGFEGDLGRGCRSLSFGSFRKLLLADALSSGADLVVVDEANVGLDRAGHRGLGELIAATCARGATVVAAVQDGEVLHGADSTVVVVDRSVRRVHSADANDVEIGFSGPSDQIASLLRAASDLGFRPREDRP